MAVDMLSISAALLSSASDIRIHAFEGRASDAVPELCQDRVVPNARRCIRDERRWSIALQWLYRRREEAHEQAISI